MLALIIHPERTSASLQAQVQALLNALPSIRGEPVSHSLGAILLRLQTLVGYYYQRD
jgi:hypothetical protein